MNREKLLSNFAGFVENQAINETKDILQKCISDIWYREHTKSKSNGKKLTKSELKALNIAKGYLSAQIQKLNEK